MIKAEKALMTASYAQREVDIERLIGVLEVMGVNGGLSFSLSFVVLLFTAVIQNFKFWFFHKSWKT